jgi:hypothetical protein
MTRSSSPICKVLEEIDCDCYNLTFKNKYFSLKLNILDDSNVTVYYIIAVFQQVLYLCPAKRNLLKNILTGH